MQLKSSPASELAMKFPARFYPVVSLHFVGEANTAEMIPVFDFVIVQLVSHVLEFMINQQCLHIIHDFGI